MNENADLSIPQIFDRLTDGENPRASNESTFSKDTLNSVYQDLNPIIRKQLFTQRDVDGARELFQKSFDVISSHLSHQPWSADLGSSYEDTIRFFRGWKASVTEMGVQGTALAEDLDKKQMDITKEMEGKIIGTMGEDVLHRWNDLKSDRPELDQLRVKSGTVIQDQVLTATGGFFEDPSNYGREIVFRIVTGDNLEHYQRLMDSRKISARSAAEMLGIIPENMKPELLRLFIFFHEIGHAEDYITHYMKDGNGPDKWTERSRREMSSLPIPGINPSRLRVIIEQNQETLPEAIQVRIREEGESQVIEDQERAYRELPKEKYADEFAASSVRKYFPEMIQ